MGTPHPGSDSSHRGRWAFVLLGLGALLWFLVRVVPKPRRVSHPCQRVAAPLAGSFVVWVLSVVGVRAAWHRARHVLRQSRPGAALAWCAVAVLAGMWALTQMPAPDAQAMTRAAAHGPLGVGQGIHPGRVVWVRAPEATDWGGFTSPEPWWASNHTDLATVERMLTLSVESLAGETNAAAAWDAVFRYFNETHGRGYAGYSAGERIAIKLNLTTSVYVDPATYDKTAGTTNYIDPSPQLLLALLRQLVYTVGVAPSDISLGDPTRLFPNYQWNLVHAEFPAVHYLDNLGRFGREPVAFSAVPVHWSAAAAAGKRPDYVPTAFAEATYVINLAVLKWHSSGITLCGKNHYGSLIRTPDGTLWGVATNYYDLHLSLPNPGWSPGLGHYRAMVDLMAHPDLGGKTVLNVIDGLFGGYYWEARPRRWTQPPFGDGTNGDWPSSLFVSQDPVAIDSVGYDFLNAEWPEAVASGGYTHGALEGGAEDYLHESALAANPPSGTRYDPDGDGAPAASLGAHEHWNNAASRQYSRNLGLDEGIELVALSGSSVLVPEASPRVRFGGVAVTNACPALRVRNLTRGAAYTVQQKPRLGTNLWDTAGAFTAATHEVVWRAAGSNAWPGAYYRLHSP